MIRFRLHHVVPAVVAVTLSACADAGVSTSPNLPAAPSASVEVAAAPARSANRLATVEYEGRTPVVYIQNSDGTDRVRVHFEHVSDHVTGNYSPRQLPVTDSTIRRISRLKWSPDGRYLAVILAPSSEALQVVLVSAEGRALRTVSPNSQYLWGDVEWSPDSRHIVYAMATGPFGLRPELMVTDLGSDKVGQITTGARLSGYDTFRFDASGQRIYFTQRVGWADDGINSLERLASVDLATGTIVPADVVVGVPQGISRDGTWALFIRTNIATRTQELIRRTADGAETVLATGDLWGAMLLEGDREALLMGPGSDDPSGSALSFRVIGLDAPADVRATLPTSPSTTWAALLPAIQ